MSSNEPAGGRPRSHRPAPDRGESAGRQSSADAGAPDTAFARLGVPETIVAALAAGGVTVPFPIQAAALPDALAGRDVLGRARTGSGKTIAFAVPAVSALLSPSYRRTPGHPGVLVLVPTRELASQVAHTMDPLCRAVGLRCTAVHGGVSQRPQTSALARGTDIVVATPGRLEDLIAQRRCHLDAVRTVVLDEADHMADLGFLPAVRRLLDQTPPAGQRLLFSATLDDAIQSLSRRYLRDPATHAADAADAPPPRLEHHLFTVQAPHKATVVGELASGAGRSLLFTRTRHGARKLARQLTAAGIAAVDLHSDLSQSARQRNLARFTDGTVTVLVATDIAARGIHVDDISLVVHVDPPADQKAYLHRSGRTARAGTAGSVVTIATPEQAREMASLFRKTKISHHAAQVGPGDPRTTALAGPPLERRRPAQPPAAAPVPSRRDRPRRRARRPASSQALELRRR